MIASMTMGPRLRKFALTAHVTFSVGWLGAVLAYLPLTITGLTSDDTWTVRSAYLAMESIGWFVIVPLCFGALLSGIVQSLGTEWGLFRHYWILAKLALTLVATTILLLHLPAVSRMAATVATWTLPIMDAPAVRGQFVVHAAGGLVVLLLITALSIFKPWGRTRWGRP
jgi:hypothetical protein